MEKLFYKNNKLIIYNILRQLGLRPNHNGTKFAIKAIQLILDNNNIIKIKDIYENISKSTISFTPEQIRISIKYAIDLRNEQKSIQNFKKIFNYDYDEEIFSNKDFLEEIANILQKI